MIRVNENSAGAGLAPIIVMPTVIGISMRVCVGGSDFSTVDDRAAMGAPVVGSPAKTDVERCCAGAGRGGGGMVAVGEDCRKGCQSGVRSRASMSAFEKSMQDGKRSLWFFAKALVKTGR